MGDSPRVRRGEVRSPVAFFPGIVRGVLADHELAGAATSGGDPSRLDTRQAMASPPPDAGLAEREAGRLALPVRRLFADGADHASVCQTLKSPIHVSPMFLKKTGRVRASGGVALIAYLVYALIQHAVRSAMDKAERLVVEARQTGRLFALCLCQTDDQAPAQRPVTKSDKGKAISKPCDVAQ